MASHSASVRTMPCMDIRGGPMQVRHENAQGVYRQENFIIPPTTVEVSRRDLRDTRKGAPTATHRPFGNARGCRPGNQARPGPSYRAPPRVAHQVHQDQTIQDKEQQLDKARERINELQKLVEKQAADLLKEQEKSKCLEEMLKKERALHKDKDDELANVKLALKEAEEQIQKEKEERQAHAVEAEKLLTDALLTNEKEKVCFQRERQELEEMLQRERQEKEALKMHLAESETLVNKLRDTEAALSSKLNILQQEEKESLIQDNDSLFQALIAADEMKTWLLQENETLIEDNEDLIHAFTAAEDMRLCLMQERDVLQQETERLLQEREGLMQEREGLLQERDVLQTTLWNDDTYTEMVFAELELLN